LQLVAVTGDRVYFRRNAWNGHRQVDELRSFGASGGEEGGVFPLRGHAAAVYGSRIVALGGAGPDPLRPSRTILNDTLWISDNGLSWREAWTASGGSWRQRMAPVLVYYPGPPEGVYVLGGEGAQWFTDTYRISTELRAPKADFIVLNPFDRQRLIRFEDRSDPGSLPIARWVWSFGDDTPDYVGPVPPVHRYERPGRYTVTLRVESPAGADEAEKEAYIYIQEE